MKVTNRFELVVALILPVLWIGWLIYWWRSARDVKETRRREAIGSLLQHRVPLLLAALLLAAPGWWPKALQRRFLPAGPFFPVAGLLLLAGGLGFSIWARRHLGRNWSAHVAVKENHALIRTGPYRHLRHPIYSGILLAFLGTVVVIGEWRGVLALLLALVAFVRKSQLEEQHMRQIFPEYEQYQRETAAIIPFLY